MDFEKLKKEVVEWSTRNFGEQATNIPLFGAAEEIGELCHAYVKGTQKIRHTPEEIVAKKKDAIGDIIIYLADYAGRADIPLGHLMSMHEFQLHKLNEETALVELWKEMGYALKDGIFSNSPYVEGVVQKIQWYCQVVDISFEDAVSLTWNKVRERDWTKNPLMTPPE